MVNYPYNVSNMLNSSSILDLSKGVDTMLGSSIVGGFIMLMVFSVVFLILKGQQYAASSCFAVACFVNVILAILLRAMGLLSNYLLWFSIFLAALSAFVLYLSGNAS